VRRLIDRVMEMLLCDAMQTCSEAISSNQRGTGPVLDRVVTCD
jgi:hypothetical protein